MRLAALLLAAAVFGPGCKTQLYVEDVSQDVAERHLDGIPFRVRETHTLRVFQYQAPSSGSWRKGKFSQVYVTHQSLPNPNHVFALNFRAEAFTSHKFAVEFQPDSTLKSISLEGTPESGGAQQLASDVVAVAEKVRGLEDEIKAKERELAAAQQTQDLATFDDIRTYEEKFTALQILCEDRADQVEDVAEADEKLARAEAALDANVDDTKTEALEAEVAAAEAALKTAEAALRTTDGSIRGAMWDMNRIALKLGKPPPFPDPNPSQYALAQLCDQIARLRVH